MNSLDYRKILASLLFGVLVAAFIIAIKTGDATGWVFLSIVSFVAMVFMSTILEIFKPSE